MDAAQVPLLQGREIPVTKCMIWAWEPLVLQRQSQQELAH